ncbi:MAG TPA: ABC transporter permease subunit [Candidatus Limnocylindria bacterium]|nr:ABC transporter permease subunit [Candidatus Limnocylindria bacterium]
MGAFVRVPQAFTLAAAIVLWELVARTLRPSWLPPADAVAGAFARLVSGGQLADLASTARTLVIGLAIVFVAGGVVAIAIGLSSTLREALEPYMNAALAIPTVALAPAYILIWGLSDITRVATVVSFAFAPLVVQWAAASRGLPSELLEMARSYDASRLRLLSSVVLPAAAPVLITGVRIAVVQGMKGVVSAEILIGVIGIGRLLQTAILTFDLARLYAVILTLMIVTFGVHLGLERLERRASRRTAGD